MFKPMRRRCKTLVLACAVGRPTYKSDFVDPPRRSLWASPLADRSGASPHPPPCLRLHMPAFRQIRAKRETRSRRPHAFWNAWPAEAIFCFFAAIMDFALAAAALRFVAFVAAAIAEDEVSVTKHLCRAEISFSIFM